VRITQGRTYLTWLWVVAFSIVFLGFLYLRFRVEIGPDSASRLFESILTQYVPLVGAILGFSLAKHVKESKTALIPAASVFVAITMSILWNLLAAGLVLQACLDPDKTPDTISGLTTYVPKLSWIVSPVLGFFFGKSPEADS
jgi:hypothetical protein